MTCVGLRQLIHWCQPLRCCFLFDSVFSRMDSKDWIFFHTNQKVWPWRIQMSLVGLPPQRPLPLYWLARLLFFLPHLPVLYKLLQVVLLLMPPHLLNRSTQLKQPVEQWAVKPLLKDVDFSLFPDLFICHVSGWLSDALHLGPYCVLHFL